MILDMFTFLSAVEPEVVIDAAVAPDMYEKLDLSSKQDKKLLKEMAEEDNCQNGI